MKVFQPYAISLEAYHTTLVTIAIPFTKDLPIWFVTMWFFVSLPSFSLPSHSSVLLHLLYLTAPPRVPRPSPECYCATPSPPCAPPRWRWCTAVPRPRHATCCRSSARRACCSAPTRAAPTGPRTVRAWCSTSRTSTCPSPTSGAPATSSPSCSR